jgi:quercetin dioxygenase-like cupin family protein
MPESRDTAENETGDPGPAPTGQGSRADFRIFTGEPVVDLMQIMDFPGYPEEVVNSIPPDEFARMAGGAITEVVFCHEDPDGYSLAKVSLAADMILPAHTHNVDCLYYVIAGRLHLGRRCLGPGAGFYVPRGARYGYRAGPDGVTVLEFRHATSFDIDVTDKRPSTWNGLREAARKHDGWPGFFETAGHRNTSIEPDH